MNALDPGWDENVRAAYGGRWVAHLNGRIIAQGGTPAQALKAARGGRYKEVLQVSYVSTTTPFAFSDLLERVKSALPPGLPVYLVGGAVRDALLGRPTHDLDFVLQQNALATSRRVANAIGAAFFPLDTERDTGRLVIIQSDGSRQVLDFAAFRGPDLESDLQARDFTVNAMAVSVQEPQKLLDPLGGAADLRAKILRACSSTSFIDDPLRIMRGIRLAAAFGFHIDPDTRRYMRRAVGGLEGTSPERLRDELFRILDGPAPSTSLRALDMLGVLPYVLPELPALRGVEQSPPHVSDVWDHTLNTLQKLSSLLAVLNQEPNEDASASLFMGMVSILLGRYREQLYRHFQASLNPDRSMKALLFLAALYHDAGKPQTQSVDADGRLRFFEHELAGAELAARRGVELRLSNVEVERLQSIVRHHLRPMLLAQAGQPPSRRAIFRFFRDTGPAGVDVCLLSLADVLATYGPTLPQEAWQKHLEVVRALLEAWWERPEENVNPPAVVNGTDLMNSLGLSPGPQVGELLDLIREAQADGMVRSREEALEFARKHVNQG